MRVFEGVDARSQIVGCISGEYGASGLKNHSPRVVMFVDVMNCDTRLMFTIADDIFMNAVTIHALATMERK
jgi:hypothetical protein